MPDVDCEAAVSSILAVLRERTGTDFSRYRAATVHRRIQNRMISVGADSFAAYLHLLESSGDEARHLLNRIAIKVSRFYRNRPSFDLLRQRVLPEIAAREKSRPVRIWCAGCGCGEEPYSFAMLLEEAGIAGRVEATDLDPAAIETAQRACYHGDALAELPPELAARYLLPSDGRRPLWKPTPPVRARVRFTRLDLLSGEIPGPGEFDIVSCRNVLIYLQAEARAAVFRTLCQALDPAGFLLLGEAEWPPEELAGSLECLGHGARLFRAREESPK